MPSKRCGAGWNRSSIMNEKEMGDALLKWDASKSGLGLDPRELTAQVLDRDRRRVRRWTVVASVFWFLAFAGIMIIFVAGGFAFPRIAYLLQQSQENSASPITGPNGPFTALAK